MAAGSQVERHRRSQLKVMLQCPPFLFFVWSGSTCNTAPAFSYLTGMRKNSALSPVGRARLSNLMAPALKPWKQVCQSMLNSRPSRSSSSICGESVVLLSWCRMLLSSACISASVRGTAPFFFLLVTELSGLICIPPQQFLHLLAVHGVACAGDWIPVAYASEGLEFCGKV